MAGQLPVGGTAVGIAVKEGVVLASEKRLAYGYTILSKSAKKVYVVENRMAVAFAGLVGDMQNLSKRFSAFVRIYELENQTAIKVSSAARLLSSMLYQSRFTPYFTETILGGLDSEGAHLFTFDPLGSVLPDRYTALGSGSQLALGLLETRYDEKMGLSDAVRLAKDAVYQATLRDIESGDGIDVVYIDASAVHEESVQLKAWS
ncbi:MAG: proteasome subunit beta [Thermoprotei archaeon]